MTPGSPKGVEVTVIHQPDCHCHPGPPRGTYLMESCSRTGGTMRGQEALAALSLDEGDSCPPGCAYVLQLSVPSGVVQDCFVPVPLGPALRLACSDLGRLLLFGHV